MVVRATVTAYETRIGNNLLHGVVPVTEGFSGPLFLRTPGGAALPTEQYVGIRGPGDATRTIELRALHNSSVTGSQQYTVEDGTVAHTASFHDHVTVTLSADAPDTFASSQADPLALVTFTSRLLQGGVGTNTGSADDVTRTIIQSGELQSGTGSGSRLFGYRAHITTVSGVPDVWLVDMTIMNGNVGNPGSPLGSSGILHHLFFNEIRVSISTPGYSILHLHGTPYTSSTKLMTPLSGGKLHVLRQGGGKIYRFAIHNNASLANAAVMLARSGFFVADRSSTLWSWSNPNTSWYGPHALPVPDIDLSGFHPYGANASNIWGTGVQYGNNTSGIVGGLFQGTSIPFPENTGGSTPLGPYHFRGPTDGGYSGGQHITAFRGYEVANTGSPSKLKAHMAILSMDADRAACGPAESGDQPSDTGIFICDANQAPIDCDEWDLSNLLFINNPGKLNKNHQGPWPRMSASQWRLAHAQSANLMPGYYSQIAGFALVKDSHIIRATGACTPLIWLANDPVAKDWMAHVGSWGRMHTLEYGPATPNQSELNGSSDLWNSYQVNPENVQLFPGKGARKGQFGGRIGGWAIYTQAIDWLATDDDAKRTAYEPWFTMLKAHDELAQFQVGSKNWQAWSSPTDHPVQDLDFQWANVNGYTGTPDACASQTIEVGIRGGANLCVNTCTGDPDYLEMLASACDGLYDYHRAPGSGTFHFVVPVRPLSDISDDAWAEPYVGPGPSAPGEAPDCFTDLTDNFQVGTLVAAALKHDQNHAKAWATIYAFTGTSTAVDARGALLALFPEKMEESWGPVLAQLQGFTDSPQVFPSPARVVVRAVAPTVVVDAVVTPSPARVVVRAIAPTRLTGGVDPSPARVVIRAIAPSLDVPVAVSPRPARVVLVVPPPTVVIPVEVAPSPAVVRIVAISTIQVNTPLGPKWLLYDENGAEYYLSMDDDGGLPVIDEDGTVFSLVLTEP